MNSHTHRLIDIELATLRTLDIDDLARRLHAAVELERRHPTRPDGYPDHTPGAAPVTGHSHPDDDNVTLTATERAAAALIAGHVDKSTALAYNATRQLVGAAHAARQALAALEELRGRTLTIPDTAKCWALDRVGGYEPVRSTITISIEDAKSKTCPDPAGTYPLGQWAYRRWHATGRLPSIAECREHVAGHRVTRKAP